MDCNFAFRCRYGYVTPIPQGKLVLKNTKVEVSKRKAGMSVYDFTDRASACLTQVIIIHGSSLSQT